MMPRILFLVRNDTVANFKKLCLVFLLPVLHRSCQSVLVEGNKVVSTVTLQATAEVMKDGVTCEVSNEHGTDMKTFPVSLTKGQCQEMTACFPSCVLHVRLLMFSFISLMWFYNEPSVFNQMKQVVLGIGETGKTQLT